MKIVIPGGSGQLGALLARAFVRDGHDVVVLSRHVTPAPWRVVAWDAVNAGAWTREIDGADVVINLAGRSVDCRYTDENRKAILDSRVQSTRAVGNAIQAAAKPPRVWLQMSTATIYSHRYDAPNDEHSGIIGGNEHDAPPSWRFSIQVAESWEAAAMAFETPATRKVMLRTAMVMSADRGGVFDMLLRLVRFGLGGAHGNGMQYMSWIHGVDFVRAIQWLVEHDEISGAVNLSSPHPVPNREFMRDLRDAWGMPIGLPANELMLTVGTFILRSETELVLKSRRVTPSRLLESGFRFDFPSWDSASRDLCARWRSGA